MSKVIIRNAHGPDDVSIELEGDASIAELLEIALENLALHQLPEFWQAGASSQEHHLETLLV